MSIHFEILKKAARAEELFGPRPDTENDGSEAVGSDSDPFLPSRVARSPVSVDTQSLEAWRQLLRYLFPFQNSRACR